MVSTAAPSKVFWTEYTYFYDADGQPTNVKDEKRRRDDGSFQTTSYTYNAHNRLLTTTLPDNVVIVNEYTGDYLTKTYFKVGGVAIPQLTSQFDYDSRGNCIKEWDALSNLTQYGYDDLGRLTSVTNALGEQSIFTYSGDLLTQTESGHTAGAGEGQIKKFLYDTRGRLTGIQRKDDGGTFQTYRTSAFDSEGSVLSSADAIGRTTTTAYDLLGRVMSTTDPLSKVTQFGYDAAGNQIRITDALSRQTLFEYDDFNRQIASVEQGVSPYPRTEYSYDANGNLTAVKDAENRITAYTYDALSRNTKVTQPLGQEVAYTYDTRDRLDYLVTARGQKVDYDYETWGALKEEKDYPTVGASTPDRTITYGHDAAGNLTAVADSAIQVGNSYTFTYDALNRKYDEVAKYLPGGDRTLQHRYDRFGNRSQFTLQDGGAVVSSYTYNKLNRLAAVTLAGGSISLSYFDNDDVQTLGFPGSVSRTYSYKANGPIDTITVTGPSGQLAQSTYTYDDVRNVDVLVDSDGSHNFDYDGLNRLTQATHPSGIGLPTLESFTYTGAGDRKDPSAPSSWTYDNNHRITGSPGLTYNFDASGNLSNRSDSMALTYDARQRLIQVVKSGVTSTYLLDAFGRRIRKTVGSQATWFLWDGGRLLSEYNAIGSRAKRYGSLGVGETADQVEDGNGTYFVHKDVIGTPRLLTDATGQAVWRARSEAFGRAVVDEDVDGNLVYVSLNQRFPGQYYDAETGFFYNYFRDYDSAVGRYVESDPVGLKGGMNTYGYANGRPNLRVDPMGLFSLAVLATWSEVDEMPEGYGNALGLTTPYLRTVDCKCTHCGGEWRLTGCSAFLEIEVLLRLGGSRESQAFTRRGEEEHVGDYKAGAEEMRRKGGIAETAMQGRRFSTQAECERTSADMVRSAVEEAIHDVFNETAKRDSSGSHTYRGH